MLLGVDNLAKIRLDAQHWALRRMHRWARRLRPAAARHLETGLEGELEAYFHLRRLGYTVVARRWRSPKLRGDLDLIAWHKDCLCFIEVKARTRRDLYRAELQVDEEKERMLRRMAAAYLRRFPEEERRTLAVRFDVVSVYLEAGQPVSLEVFPAAF